MRDKEDKLAHFFRERLENYSMDVDPEIWIKIEQDLAQKQGSNRHVPIWKYVSIAASVLLVLSLGIALFYSRIDKTDKSLLTQNSKETVHTPTVKESLSNITPQTSSTLSSEKQNTLKESASSRKKTSSIQKNVENQIAVIKNDNLKSNKSGDQATTIVAENESSKKTELKKDKKEKDLSGKNNKLLPGQNLYADAEPLDFPHKKKEKKPLELALAVGNSGSTSSGLTEKDNFLRQNSPSGLINYYSANDVAAPLYHTEYEYRQPISMGFLVRKYLTKHWAIESGLSYTYLSSTEKVRTDYAIYSENDVECHYLGIPVKMVYSIFDSDRLSFYATGGGVVEKMIHGTRQTEMGKNQKTTNLDVPELQYSVSGSVGINYILVKKLGLFLEPGLGYYFDDGSDLMTIRKDKPFNFTVQAGLRLVY